MEIRWDYLSQTSAWLLPGLYFYSQFPADTKGITAGLFVFAKVDWSRFPLPMEVQ